MEGDFLPFLLMVTVQLGYAGMNIISKLAMDSGMSAYVHVAYRQIFATVALAPVAYFLERKTRPKMTLPVFIQIFLCSFFGVTVNQITYFIGLKNSTPTIACALSNIIPAVTFIIAVPLGQEKIVLKSKGGQAKVWGTMSCVSGALLVSFYHGSVLNIGQSAIHWKYVDSTPTAAPAAATAVAVAHHGYSLVLGPLLLIASAVSWAIWLIIQTKISSKYDAPYSSSALMCVLGSIQCTIVAISLDHDLSAWSLAPTIRIVSSVYAGLVGTAVAFCFMSWCVARKGPLYVSVFSPLLLVIVAILSWVLLREKLYIGTVGGSALIVSGLYAVLWGKKKEMVRMAAIDDGEKVSQTTAAGADSPHNYIGKSSKSSCVGTTAALHVDV
ncbi:WAT1-related protein At1g09380 [Andrographis paniculata]|uniref:WAT1-related protein At1g09380 n=1 Tax=Andrographis paniculata TaxID=175694 RepID=UPI0021E92A42|nr:WAT1-related protein At1g09380 [Andrographis paniculata]